MMIEKLRNSNLKKKSNSVEFEYSIQHQKEATLLKKDMLLEARF